MESMGDFESFVVFGFQEINEEVMIEPRILEQHGLEAFCEEVIRFVPCDVMYGVKCSIDNATGTPHVSDFDRKKVVDFYNKIPIDRQDRFSEITFLVGLQGNIIFEYLTAKYDPLAEVLVIPKRTYPSDNEFTEMLIKRTRGLTPQDHFLLQMSMKGNLEATRLLALGGGIGGGRFF